MKNVIPIVMAGGELLWRVCVILMNEMKLVTHCSATWEIEPVFDGTHDKRQHKIIS